MPQPWLWHCPRREGCAGGTHVAWVGLLPAVAQPCTVCEQVHLHLLFKTQEKEEVVIFWAGFSLTLSEGPPVSVYQWWAGGEGGGGY